jgi:hypothetical protein
MIGSGSVALHFMYFVRIHKTLRMTPAMAAGVSDKLWEIADIVALIDAKEPRSQRCAGLTGNGLTFRSSRCSLFAGEYDACF